MGVWRRGDGEGWEGGDEGGWSAPYVFPTCLVSSGYLVVPRNSRCSQKCASPGRSSGTCANTKRARGHRVKVSQS